MIQAIDYDGDDNQLVTGVPGSGKTTVTIMRAERLVTQGRAIRVFTFQNLLRTSLRNTVSPGLRDSIFGFYEWFYRKFGYLNPSESEEQMLTRMEGEPVIDEILIDEGQDFEERIYRSLLPKCKKMTVGADNAQRVHSRGLLAEEIRKELQSYRTTIQVRLEYNYRNTYEIYNFARYFMPNNERVNREFSLNLMPRGNGSKPVIIQVMSEAEKLNRLKVILEDAGDKNIAILLYHKSEVDDYHRLVTGMGLKATKWYNGHQPDDIENILITTYKSAKGLEFQVVIMPDMEKAMTDDAQTCEHYYIGCTRTKEALFLTYTGNEMPACFRGFHEDAYELQLSGPEPESVRQSNITEDDFPF